MNQHEQQFLKQFLDQLIQARAVSKDSDAEALIKQAADQQADALYLLVQKACIQQQALVKAQEQIAQLKEEVSSLQSQTSNASAPAENAKQGFFAGAPFMNQTIVPPSSQQGVAAASNGSGGFFGNFLSNAATTAAGVAGGAFLFEGLRGLLGGGHAQASPGQGFFSSPVEDVSTFSNNGNSENMESIGNFFDSSINDNANEQAFIDNDNDVLLDSRDF
ncbi:MAG: DUF2076 family protein [Pseudomonadota bacterium]